MRSLGFRRAALATGVAAVAAVALAGCSAGQVAETALKRPSNMGVNADNSDGSILIRNLAVQYPGTAGYKAGENAPLELGLFNQTRQAITVLVSSQPASAGGEVVSASSVGLTGGAAASTNPKPAEPEASASPSAGADEPEASASPSASAAPAPAGPVFRPARIEVPAMGSVAFLPGDIVQLQAIDLAAKLAPGQSLNLVFEFSNGAHQLVVQAPVGIPLTPASRGPGGVTHEDTEE